MRRLYLALILAAACLTPVSAQTWSYRIIASHGGADLQVVLRVSSSQRRFYSVDDGAEPYVRHVQLYQHQHWVSLYAVDGIWKLPLWTRKGCLMRYDFSAGEAARKLHNLSLAERLGAILHVCPEAFLLRPCDNEQARIEFCLTTTDGTQFVSGYHRVGPNTWRCRATDLPLGPDAAFGPLRVKTLHVRDTTITLAYAGMPLSDGLLAAWVKRQSRQVARYFGGFPVRHLLVLMLPTPGDGTEGHARGGGGASVCIGVGRDVTGSALLHDTVYVHELVHVCTPALPNSWHWMEEGIATYLERIIPAQAGDLSPRDVWLGMLADLPQGLPGPDDGGLNRCDNDDRTYFGGALYWLLADVQIQEHSHGHHSLRTVMRALHRGGASITRIWNVHQVLGLGEKSTGVDVLTNLYGDMAFKAYRPDLPHLWDQLGITPTGTGLTLHPAPLSSVRRALTPPRSAWMGVLQNDPGPDRPGDAWQVMTQWFFDFVDND